MIHGIRLVAIAGALFATALAGHGAEQLQPGDRFPEFGASDQHGTAYRFQRGTKTVLIAFDMSTGKMANRILSETDADFLPRYQAVYVSNVYGMPAIGRYFALRKMRKYPHRIIVADAEHLLAPFPKREGRVTVIRLDDDAVIRSIRFWNPEEAPIEDFLE